MKWKTENGKWKMGMEDGRRPFSVSHLPSQRRPRRRGAAIIEAALVMLILFYMSFGAAEAGYYLWIKHGMEGAAREGARAAITANARQQDVIDAIYGATDAIGLPRNEITYKITLGSTSGGAIGDVSQVAQGKGICVQVICNWKDVGIHPMNLFGDTATGTAVMRKEGS